jgi:hypothetical protein
LPFIPGAASASILTIVTPSVVMSGILAGFKSLAMVAAFVVTCLWLWKCRQNVADLRPSARQRRAAGWVWGSWLTPVVAWWFPLQVVSDIGSDTHHEPDVCRPPRLGWWWVTFIGMQWAGWTTAVLRTISESAEWWFAAETVEAVLTLAALALWIPVIRHIDRDQAVLTGGSPLAESRGPALMAGSIAVALLATGLGLATTTTLPSRPQQSEPDGPRYEAPAIGDCHTLGSSQLNDASDGARPVSCSDRHTSVTYAVGTIEGSIDDFDGDQACENKRLNEAVGRDYRLTYANWTFYVPTIEQEDHGARWYRCDLYVEGSSSGRLLELPVALPLIKDDSGSSPFMVCSTDLRGPDQLGDIVRCSQEHAYEAVKIATLPTTERWPGDAKVDGQARDACEDELDRADRYDFLYGSPSRKDWKELDEVTFTCYARRDEASRPEPRSAV